MRSRRVWGAAAAVAAGLSGVLVFQGVTGAGDFGTGGEAKGGPVRTDVRSAGLETSADGRSAALGQRDTEPFSLLGVTWTDPAARVKATVEARTRGAESGRWGRWLTLDGDTGQGESGAERGGTEPAWVGPSTGVEVRITAGGRSSGKLPAGLRLHMIDPGKGDARSSAMEPAAFAVETGEPSASGEPSPTEPAPSEPAASEPAPSEPAPSEPATGESATSEPAPSPSTASPEPSASASTSPIPSTSPSPSATSTVPPAPPSSMPQPPVTSRAQWGADESISPEEPGYLPGGKVKAVVVHHTAESNAYACADGPALVRGIYAYHVKTLGWKDIGYNFLVDRCGVVYEGRKGGIDRPVMGAHAYGFNGETTGISVLGTYTDIAPPEAALTSVARVAGWKLGQYGVSPTGTTTLTAGAGGTNYFGKSWAKGAQLSFPTIHGHRDGYNTQCPGNAFYAQLPNLRKWAAGPVAGLTITSVSAPKSGTTHYTKAALAVGWSATTPSSLIKGYELLVDGKPAVAVAGTATSASTNLALGSHSVAVRATHHSGSTSTSAAVTVVAETTAPAFTTRPTLALRTGTVNTTAVPVTLSWKATDNAALKSVRLTAPASVTYATTSTSAARTATSGVATAWNMTAYDVAGNTGSASGTFTPVILQETSAVRSGTWTTKSSTSYLGGKSYSSGAKGASLTWTFTGRSASWVVSRASTSGQAYVYVDGVKVATVDLKSSTTKYRDAIWTKTWATSAKHTVKVVVVGTSGRPAITTDGLVYLK
ncbi:N-acetylmuramoyl-L-alanine amidase [Streptomyces ficellus]|uniref:N-acetylmuramoyl-L-alanine amidase n=1 Tax=Streptomyces ficellus TaxID=1977088 RepID=A0ABT7ZAQ5_9ACTN|nr:N-acetylmuramoyl-L-alanine amidase [Streptomyces ficellus]MDN3296597.1 N-acetylmuramoyl-L-alanine amidase [Streptomyces ficellus]